MRVSPITPAAALLRKPKPNAYQTLSTLPPPKRPQDRERLQDEVRLHKQGCCRAEDLLRKHVKDADAAAAARLRLEEANRRLLEELRCTRLSYLEAEGTIRQLLHEIVEVKESARAQQQQQQQHAGVLGVGAPALSGPLPTVGSSGALAAAAAAGGYAVGGVPGRTGTPPLSGLGAVGINGGGNGNTGRPRRGDLVRQVAALQAVAHAASGAQVQLQQQVEDLAAEKERVEGNERLVSRQTEALLVERRRLMGALAAEKDAVREMEAGIGNMAHQVGALDRVGFLGGGEGL